MEAEDLAFDEVHESSLKALLERITAPYITSRGRVVI
jgi:hypothetical protein